MKEAQTHYQTCIQRFADAENDMLNSNLQMLTQQNEYGNRSSQVIILQQMMSKLARSRPRSDIDSGMVLL
jgi:hypothetical protein